MNRFALALALAASLALTAWGQEKVTLKVLNQIDATQAGYAEDRAIWAKFAADNPDIVIDKEELFNEPFHDKVRAYIAAGTIPDVQFMWPSGRSTELQQKGLTKDLAPLLGKDFLSKFNPAAVDPRNQLSHKLAELPRAVTYTSVMYVNKGLLDRLGLKVPKTYADLKAMVPRLKAKGVATILMANKDQWPMQSCLFSTISGRLTGDEFIDKVLAGKAKFTDKGFVDALGVVKSLYDDGIISTDTLQLGYGESPALFASGKAAFLIDGDWRVGNFLTDKASGVALIDPAKQKSDFELMAFPALRGEKQPGSVSAIVGVGYGISASIPAGSAKEKAAVKLIKYLYSPEVLRIRLEIGDFIPSRTDVKSDKLEPLTAKMMAYFVANPKTTYVLDGVLPVSVTNSLNEGLQAIGLGAKEPAQVAADMQAATDAWIAAGRK
jgi:raffinose/stachyose/melibiose transport system substrate-binding protein